MFKNDWLKYCGNTPYTYNGLYNSDYGWNTWNVIQDLYDNGELTYQTTKAIEKIDKLQKSVYNKNVKSKEQNEKEKETTMFDSNNFFGKLFGKVAPGQVRLSMNGDMAIKTSNGYKTYNVEDGSLTNCDNFVFDIGSEFFFIIPTNKVEKGDVILASGKPHCVIKTEDNRIEALRYEDGSIVNIVPERTLFMGKTYFYGKIVSMFGKVTGNNGDKGMKNMMKYFIMSEMMGKNNSNNGNMNSMLPMMMFMGSNNMEDMFEGMFDFSMDSSQENKEEN